MKFNLIEDYTYLNITTPYMLRSDGAVFTCGDNHPYVKISLSQSFDKNYEDYLNHPNFRQWYLEHSNNPNLKNLVSKNELTEDEFEDLNNLANQEFCRFRTSNFKYKLGGDNGEIYFRISSRNFNWFELIWNVVYQNKDWIRNVTLMKDVQTFGKDFDYYYLEGKKMFHIDVDDFLNLKGNPIIG